MTDEIIVKMIHVRKALQCSGGARKFFKRHHLDWSDFLRNGISVSKLEKIDDAMCRQVIEEAKNGR